MLPLKPLYTLGWLAKVTRLHRLRLYLQKTLFFFLSSYIHIRRLICSVVRDYFALTHRSRIISYEPSASVLSGGPLTSITRRVWKVRPFTSQKRIARSLLRVRHLLRWLPVRVSCTTIGLLCFLQLFWRVVSPISDHCLVAASSLLRSSPIDSRCAVQSLRLPVLSLVWGTVFRAGSF